MRNNLFSPSQPINHSVSERVSLSASTRLEKLFRNKRKGSVTVEAAATVPLFFLAVVTLLYLLEMMAVHTAVRSSLQYAGKQAAKDTCITQMLMPSKVERDVVYAIRDKDGKKYHCRRQQWDGLFGIKNVCAYRDWNIERRISGENSCAGIRYQTGKMQGNHEDKSMERI